MPRPAIIARDGHPPVSRRQFLATGSALLAGTCVPAWASIVPAAGGRDDARRAEVAEAALARAAALGASYADIRINRYRRESIATRERQVQNVSRTASYGLGLRVLVNGAWGFAATNRVEPAAARAAAEQAVAIARANAVLATRKVVLANADKVVTTWTSAFKRDPFEVPLETKIAFLMKLNETALAVAGVSFVSSQILFVDEQKFFASSEGSRITQRLVRTYPQFTTTAADRASGDFQTRAVVDRAQLVGYEYVEDYPWLRDAEKAGHEVVEKLKSKPVAPGRYDIVVDPSQLFLAIHESVGHSTELDRALGWEANMAGTSFLKAADAGKLRFGAKIVNLVGDRTQPGGLATTGFDDEGVKADRWHLVRDGMFVDWQTTRELAPLVGQTAIARLPALGQLVERAVSENAERVARAGGDRGVARRSVQRHQARAVHRGPRQLVDRSAALQLSIRRRGHSRDQRRQARRDGEGRRVSVADAGFLGVVRRPRRPGDLSAVGHVGRRQGRARPDQRRQPRLSAGAVPSGHGPEHGGRLMLARDEALQICETVLSHAKDGGRRGCRRLAAKLGRIARALRRQPHHHERTGRGSRHHRHRLGRPPARFGDRQRSRRRRAEADGRRSGADRPRLAGAPRVCADARSAHVRRGARVRRRHGGRRSSLLAPPRSRRCSPPAATPR